VGEIKKDLRSGSFRYLLKCAELGGMLDLMESAIEQK
jgi:hypothetical protein